MVNTPLSSLFINEDEFNKTKPLYEKDLKSSGFNKKLKFETIQTKSTQNRKIEKVSFNPRYYAQVKTIFDKVFLKLVRKHFQK